LGQANSPTSMCTASGRKVHEVMTSSVYTVSEDASLEEVVRLMERHRIKRLPVVRGRSVFGIITRANVMRALIHVPLEAKPLSADDTVTRERLLSELEKQPWAPLATINVFVKDGVVRLSGALIDERARLALRVVAENIPGVKKVEDDMVWIEPTSGMVVEPMPT
jgi:signal-transduction protein with cAMP-binding, CBS, and nucleotidyltransferase domain